MPSRERHGFSRVAIGVSEKHWVYCSAAFGLKNELEDDDTADYGTCSGYANGSCSFTLPR